MNANLAHNLAALRASGFQVPDNPHVPAGWDLQAETAIPTLRVPGPTGVPITLHSMRDPAAEATRLVTDATRAPGHTVAVVAGVGLGFAVDALEQQYPELPVVVTDTSFDRLVPFLCRRDWSGSIGKRRLGIFSPDVPINAPGLRRLLETREGEPLVVLHPVLGRDQATELAAAVSALKQAWLGARANHQARLAFEGPYAHQTLANLALLPDMVDVRELAGLARGRVAIVVAAGPSLDRQLADIARMRHAVLLVAVDTALRPLLAAGIDPDFVVAVDPSRVNAGHLIDVGRESRAHLVAELSLPMPVFAAFADRRVAFRVGLNEPWPWLVTQGVDLGVLAAWGSVLVTAIDFACHLGCSPILLCGADLAYTDGRPYCRGTTFGRDAVACGETEDKWAAKWMHARANDLVALPDLHGQPTRAPSHFPAVRDAIGDLAVRKSPHRIVNVTGAGILTGRAIEQMSFAAASHAFIADAPGIRRTDVNAWAAAPRVSRAVLPAPAREDARAWQAIVAALRDAWPHLTDREAGGALAALRSVVIAEHGRSRLAVADDACLRWLSPLFDSVWTGELLRFVQAVGSASARWFEHLEPVMLRALSEGQVDAGTCVQYAVWVARSAGDGLYVPPISVFIGRVVDRLRQWAQEKPLPPALEAERLLLLVSLGRTGEATEMLVALAPQLQDRPLVTDALRALCAQGRAAALSMNRARVSAEIATTARTWAGIDLQQDRDSAATFLCLIHSAACSGDPGAARAYLRLGLARHPSLREMCGILALEAWLSQEPALARELMQQAIAHAAPTAPIAFQLAIAESLFGDEDRAREHFAQLMTLAPAFFGPISPPNNRWFWLARSAAALGDDTLARRAWRTAEHLDPLARQREQVAPPPAPLNSRSNSGNALPAFEMAHEMEAR